MMRASRSSSSHSYRTPFTVPCVPTGMKTGVSMTDRRVLIIPVRASPSCAGTSQLIDLSILLIVLPDQRPDRPAADRGFRRYHPTLIDQNGGRSAEHAELDRRWVILFDHDR